MSQLSERLKKAGVKGASKVFNSPLWEGPEGTGPNGGVTQSLLSRFLVCRERFRIHALEGLRTADRFRAPIEYGNMWHVCEEALAAGTNPSNKVDQWTPLANYCKGLCQKHRMQQEEINHWYEMCKAQFPVYVEWWAKHKDVLERKPLLQEQVFNVPYKLPSGRTVRLRGKWDSVDIIGKGKTAGIYLQENKTKSQIDAVRLTRQLGFDLQVMFYIIALQEDPDACYQNESHLASDDPPFSIKGVRYNVIRRSAHKTPESMLKKIGEDIAEGRGGEWFARWTVDITPADTHKFREQCFDPILEQVCDWWEWINHPGFKFAASAGAWIKTSTVALHWRHPFGVYNVLDEGGSSDLDAYLESGSKVGLHRVDNLFSELI